ncbi:hypothetical protein FF011L_08250 [Roseimaritima multifibrata]|uniref:Gamma-butyrobetaine hydroxylase-like N-terminal domain-containing protein n=1 Tax=Roseimaritima multifibrata TaxID=1930274 RepID=A0A517MB28_9BACT|nr:DUF971 domain-containing protein [Roseimaritima multifibrata]QDS92089.1 hypothetical protein FF011L_08250 [Roseimaritima multifibrata]
MSNSGIVHPTSIERLGSDQIAILWSDGSRTEPTIQQLRRACPCATCREKKKAADKPPEPSKPIGLPVLKAEEAQSLQITAMRPAGQYAYNIQFSDGHHSGLFPFELLRSI